MAAGPITRTWRRNKRRVLNLPAGIARRRLKPARTKFYRDLWTDAANKIGGELTVAQNGLLQIQAGSRATFVSQSSLMLDSDITLRVFANKALHYDLMTAKSLRLPEFIRFTLETLDQAIGFLEMQKGPIVIKPADGTGGGQGVVTGITDAEAVRAASQHAAGFNSALLAEQQLTGACFRLVYFNGEFLDAVRRDSPVVTGDGVSTITQLVKAENQSRQNPNRITALNPLTLDRECRNTLRTRGYSPKTVPNNADIIRIKLAVNENAAPQNHIVREQVHPEIIETGAQLVRDFGIKFAGLDVTSDNISAPLFEGNTYFNEINVNPGLHHHYLVANPAETADLATSLLNRMFTTGMGIVEL